MRFKRKTFEVEAWRWDESRATSDAAGVRRLSWRGRSEDLDLCRDLKIDTAKGAAWLKPGDWIVREANGGIYVVPDEIFQEHYEEILDA